MTEPRSASHIRQTSHAGQPGAAAPPIAWGAPTAAERGPIVGTSSDRARRNLIGTHSGSYGVYRALAVAAGNLPKDHRADLTDTAPTAGIAAGYFTDGTVPALQALAEVEGRSLDA